eukprot:1498590-Karenia_brevis.AAC.1
MDELADPKMREDVPDPSAGLPVKPKYVGEEVPRPPEEDEEFDRYMEQFLRVMKNLNELRKPWLDRVPMDDPM